MCHQIRHKTHAACKPTASKQTQMRLINTNLVISQKKLHLYLHNQKHITVTHCCGITCEALMQILITFFNSRAELTKGI
jgi:hypothetical protein